MFFKFSPSPFGSTVTFSRSIISATLDRTSGTSDLPSSDLRYTFPYLSFLPVFSLSLTLTEFLTSNSKLFCPFLSLSAPPLSSLFPISRTSLLQIQTLSPLLQTQTPPHFPSSLISLQKMTTPPSKPSKPKPQNPPSRSTGISSHFLMIELKQRILTSLNKLSDRDTHQIAIEDLEKIIETLSPEGISMFLNTLYDTDYIQKPILRKESVRLLATIATAHPDPVSTHLTKIIAHIVKRLKDSDSGVRDSCQATIGVLASQYLKSPSSSSSNDGENGNLGSVVSLFVKPLFEALNEQNKTVQAGSAMCLAKMVECATNPPLPSFQKLCMRICKYLNNPNFVAKASLLSVVSSLAQVGAISTQSLPVLLQCLHESLESSDWATRKAAADALNGLASHSSHLVVDGAASTITALETCRFDKVKPVRDSMTEALQAWKNIAGKGENGLSEDTKSFSQDGESRALVKSVEKLDLEKSNRTERKSDSFAKETSKVSSPSSESLTKVQNSSMSDKTVGILKKKAPILTDKELNPEFFQNLETRGSGDLPVEVVVPRRSLHSSHSQGEEESELNNGDLNGNGNPSSVSNEIHASTIINHQNFEKRPDFARDKWVDQRVFRGKDSKTRVIDSDDGFEFSQRDTSGARLGFSRNDGHSEGAFLNNKGNWLGIQRQLAQLERQQTNLMKMLQEFMGGSHDSMVTLENRVRGLERIVEDMARDLAVSSGRRGGNLMMGFDRFSPNISNGRMPFAERFPSSDGISGARGRDSPWRSDLSNPWDSYSYGTARNGHLSTRRAAGGSANDGRGTGTGTRQAWDKGQGPARLGEGPSARSVWQASKDEATLEAIRVAGEDSSTLRTTTRVPISELNAEALGDDNPEQERGPLWASWGHAMDSLHVGDVDSAYAEVLSTGDDLLLVKLMDRTGPVMDQLSNEIASEVLHAVGQFLLEQSLFDIGLSWTQQLTELVMENGVDLFGISFEGKRALLSSLHEAASAFDTPDDWEGATAEQLLMRLAEVWGIDLQQLQK